MSFDVLKKTKSFGYSNFFQYYCIVKRQKASSSLKDTVTTTSDSPALQFIENTHFIFVMRKNKVKLCFTMLCSRRDDGSLFHNISVDFRCDAITSIVNYFRKGTYFSS